MAEALGLAALNTIASDALGKLKDMAVSAAKEEAKLLWNVYEEVERLSATSKMIQAVLEDAEELQITQNSVRLWLEDLKYVTYDAEDVLEEFSMEASRGQIGQEESSKGGVATLIHWMKLVIQEENGMQEHDEFGVPFAVTFNSITTVTIHERDIKELILMKIDAVTKGRSTWDDVMSRYPTMPP